MDTYNNISWLASYPKSGSTWVRMFLNAFITKMPLNINTAYQISRRDTDTGILQMMSPTPIKELTHNEQVIYRPAMLMTMLKLAPKRLILKSHWAKVAVNTMPAHPLQISDCAVYIIRDPRDVVISLADHMNTSIDQTIEFMNNMSQGINDNNTNITDIILTWSEHVASWTTKNNNLKTMVVKYEELLDQPTEIFKQIVKFLKLDNIDNIDQRFDFALKETEFKNLQKYEETKGFIEKGKGSKFFRVGKAGQWKEILTNSQISKIKEHHSKLMKAFEYV